MRIAKFKGLLNLVQKAMFIVLCVSLNSCLERKSSGTELVSGPPVLSYATSAGKIGTRRVAMSISPSEIKSGGLPKLGSCFISSGEDLPLGLSIDNSTCVISGVPQILLTPTHYTVTLYNSEMQSTMANLTLEVDENWLDNGNSSAVGFLSGTHNGTIFDNSNSYLRIDQSGSPTNNAELESSWTPQWNNLQAYLKMNNNWNDSVHSNNGTAQNGATFSSSSKIGTYAGNFDGVNDYVSIPDTSTLSPTDKVTVMIWIKPSAFNAVWSRIVEKSASFYLGCAADCGRFAVSINDAFYLTTSGVASPVLDEWQQLAFTYDKDRGGTDELRFYLNGNKILTGDYSTAITDSSSSLVLGYSSPGTTGLMDDFAIWNTALSDDEIQTIYTRQSAKYSGYYQSRTFDSLSSNVWDGFRWITTLPFGKELTGDSDNSGSISSHDSETSSEYPSISSNTLMNNLVALWHLNETSLNSAPGGTDVEDFSGNSRHADFTGTPISLGDVGVFRKSYRNNGNPGSYSYFSTSSSIVSSGGTFSLWINSQLKGQQLFLGAGSTGFPQQFISYIFQPNMMKEVNDGGASWDDNTYGLCVRFINHICIPYNSIWHDWHHVAISWDGSRSIKIAIDGTFPDAYFWNGSAWSSASQPFTLTSNGAISSSGTIRVGGNNDWFWSGRQGFYGYVDEVAVWSRVLSNNEIVDLYRRGVNRVKFQTRSCVNSDCSDNPEWFGPNGSTSPIGYFSELLNNSSINSSGEATGRVLAGIPDFLFSYFSFTHSSSRYFQYRSILESDDLNSNCNYEGVATWCSPELKSVEIRP
ncbi:MAG: laminin G domain-containing protein [Proteobacteria bacterium]|nr:laminin G domain-containing protein [Pseudomonadota bacterium]